MKRYFSIFFTAMLLFTQVTAQPWMVDVKNELGGERIHNIVKYFDKVVDITINDKQSIYSRAQAEMVVLNFLNKNNAGVFLIKYKGVGANDDSFYLIGDLKTRGHGIFRVYLFFKQKGTEHFIQEMKFELN